jgi:hypothetical protein
MPGGARCGGNSAKVAACWWTMAAGTVRVSMIPRWQASTPNQPMSSALISNTLGLFVAMVCSGLGDPHGAPKCSIIDERHGENLGIYAKSVGVGVRKGKISDTGAASYRAAIERRCAAAGVRLLLFFNDGSPTLGDAA